MSFLEFLRAVLPVADDFFVTDSSHVVKNVEIIRQGLTPKSHLDVWQNVRDLLAEYPSRGVVLGKVESRRNLSEISDLGTDPSLFLLNELADRIANQWAEYICVSVAHKDSRPHDLKGSYLGDAI
eukprot:2012874-Pyramimonas_sp.AAC.1